MIEFSQLLANLPNKVAVVGHADTSPIAEGAAFSSNWELSIARAGEVANLIKRSGYPSDIVILGRAEGRFSDLENLPQEEREKMARRVDIMILPEGTN